MKKMIILLTIAIFICTGLTNVLADEVSGRVIAIIMDTQDLGDEDVYSTGEVVVEYEDHGYLNTESYYFPVDSPLVPILLTAYQTQVTCSFRTDEDDMYKLVCIKLPIEKDPIRIEEGNNLIRKKPKLTKNR